MLNLILKKACSAKHAVVYIFRKIVGSIFIQHSAEKLGSFVGESYYFGIFVKLFTMYISIFMYYYSLFLWCLVDLNTIRYQFITQFLNIGFIGPMSFGVDALSLYFIILTTFLFPIIFLCNWNNQDRILLSIVCLFSVEILLILSFCAMDVFCFFIFFESMPFPLVIIVGVWGSRNEKRRAAFYFFIYTALGSVCMIVGMLILVSDVGTLSMSVIKYHQFSYTRGNFVSLLFFIPFAIKVPMFPFHLWLPEAHVESPTVGSVILAALMLKLGGYGILRFFLLLFPEHARFWCSGIIAVCALGAIFSSFATLYQVDLKRLIAYSSVAHMNLVVIGLLSKTVPGVVGSLIMMVGHSFVSAGLFLLVGVLYSRGHTRLIRYYSGLSSVVPVFSIFWFLFWVANFGFPGTLNFIGECLIYVGIFRWYRYVAYILGICFFLSVLYSIIIITRSIFGNTQYVCMGLFDLSYREFMLLLPLITYTVLFGVFPGTLVTTVLFWVKGMLFICS